MNSKERVLNIINGKTIDRAPIFDLLRNDDAIEYYSEEKLTYENAERLVFKAVSKIIDATRSSIKFPKREGETVLSDGRKVIEHRWTTWNDHLRFADEKQYEKYLVKNYIEKSSDEKSIEKSVLETINKHERCINEIGDTFLFWSISGVGLVNLHAEVGLDQFSYYLYDCPEIISEALEAHTNTSIKKIKLLHELTKNSKNKPLGVFMAEDIAYKGTTMFSPKYLRKEFFPRVKRIVDECHKAGFKFIFHSDGNLMAILDDLVETGIDIINPIEIASGMDIKEIHNRHPNLIMTGGIDVTNLLPFGKPQEIKDAVERAIEDSEGKIIIGSSTEMDYGVPLENVIALYDTAVNYKY